MKVYIDNNVLIDYEENKIVLTDRDNIQYYYSYVHIDEMLELGDKLVEKKDKRLDVIKSLTKDKCLLNNENNKVSCYHKDPNFIFSIGMSPYYKTVKACMTEMQGQFAIDKKREELIEDLNIDVRRLNNYSVNEIVQEFGANLFYYVKSSAENTQTAFQSLFNFLDMIGFWADKYTDRSNMARCYDANHTYFATYCDFFVTNDKRTRNKANVAYRLMNFNTIAISSEEFRIIYSNHR